MEYMITAVVTIVLAAIALGFYMDAKRTKDLKAIADSLKFTFSKTGENLLPSLGGFDLFSKGHAKKAKNVMNGNSNGIDVTIMDYQYTTGTGKNSHTWSQTVMLFRSEFLQLPGFALRQEGLFDKISGLFGYQDIDFDTHPEFSKHYLLRGVDEDGIRSVFSDMLIAFYEQHRGLNTEGDGGGLIFYRASKRVSPKDLKIFMEEGFGVFALLAKRNR